MLQSISCLGGAATAMIVRVSLRNNRVDWCPEAGRAMDNRPLVVSAVDPWPNWSQRWRSVR
ncbi:hypothetical protein Thimo_3474 [Thioflavicoccus mobilis 8321]|uniref:Uncharacterized protein n=1 Tax=Thioflavicoccus mobilis 8321 TaxID=765912 RepID=L0H268_9GAMM|nr:hypothetical protein Thimo_3474 [Thioflavicoccus mobilis 8321]